MDKHRCKLCFKRFVNGRAMGGHMRSHMMNHQFVPPKPEPQQQQQQQQQHLPSKNSLPNEEADSASSSSSDEENEEKLLGYELRENPKKSTRLVDREFSFTTTGSDVVLIQDRESETESSRNPIRRRSKRVRRSGISNYHHIQFQNRNLNNPPEMKKSKWGKTESEPEPVSSISDTTPDEDVAYCLMMLSRDAWMREKDDDEELEEAEEKTEDSVTELNTNKSIKIRSRNRGKYKCETCFKLFRSYQALGGHRASHKKIKGTNDGLLQTHARLEIEKRNAGVDEEKIHECPVCYRVFSSGQALGGHKRSHGIGSAFGSTSAPVKPKLKSGEPLIDLNLPAPVDDDDDDYGDEFSQIENSAVSDAELFNPVKH